MIVSESWLREWVSPDVSSQLLADQLTMAGLEVDAVGAVAPAFSGVVVGEILAVEQHPDADKLRVCRVAGNGDEPVQVVCGAANAREGIKIPFATVGAVLPGDFKIKKAKLRGVESFGMLCAEEELGLAEKSEGLFELPADAPVGEDIREYLQLDDTLIEVDLTPNRGDCLSIRGIAREVAVLNHMPATPPEIPPVPAVHEQTLSVSLEADNACPRYVGRVIRDVDASADTPLWMAEKLRRAGVRSIDPIVDVTNYVLLELGQPMHAFDLDKLNGGVVVRKANQDEKLVLLDDSTVELTSDTLVIADDTGAVAMAGVMGGDSTAVTESTRNIFLESAYFDPVVIAGKARSYGKHTDSSHRFERGVDPELQVLAVERATQLLLDIVGGEPGPIIHESLEDKLPPVRSVSLRKDTLKQQLRIDLGDDAVASMMMGLGLSVESQDGQGWSFTVPSWRFDIEIEADLLEEVARIYGYNNLPTEIAATPIDMAEETESVADISVIRASLLARGYQEAITYSFVDPTVQGIIAPEEQGVVLQNPIASDMGVMRTTLWPGLLQALRNNLNRQQSRVRLFEIGQYFEQDKGELIQRTAIAGAICGSRHPEGWSTAKGDVDFFDIKGDVEVLMSNASGDTGKHVFQVAEKSALHPGQSAAVVLGGKTVGYVGKLHPTVARKLDIDKDVYLFQLELDDIRDRALPKFQEISKYPEVSLDLAFIVDEKTPVGELLNTARQAAGENLKQLKVFDVYQGKGVENNRKSIAMGLTFQHGSRTLAETEVNESASRIVDRLREMYAADLRGEL